MAKDEAAFMKAGQEFLAEHGLNLLAVLKVSLLPGDCKGLCESDVVRLPKQGFCWLEMEGLGSGALWNKIVRK